MTPRSHTNQRTEVVEVDDKRVNALLGKTAQSLPQEDHELFAAIVDSYRYLSDVISDKDTTIGQLRKLMFGSKSEKYKDVVDQGVGVETSPEDGGDDSSEASLAGAEDEDSDSDDAPDENAEPPPGHGRYGADAYSGAQQVYLEHPSLCPGDDCPECLAGTLYERSPGVLVRIVGRAPLDATVYRLQRLRCHLCGKIFTAPAPQEAGTEKYDATAISMIALLKYGSGLPFNRLQRLQGSLKIPLPASTQWDLLAAASAQFDPVYQELIRQAAQGEVLYNDDTSVKILELMGAYQQTEAEEKRFGKRTGLFTSGVVSTRHDQRIALFFSGRQHAGENLADVLKQRSEALRTPIQMSDALSRNLPKELAVIVSHCLAHARRQFVDIYHSFPNECQHLLQALRVVYKNDADARKGQLTPQQRLEYHQARSQSTMDELKTWLQRQFSDRLVEPNSSLGGAINYMLKRWETFTLFLRQAGAPLDNNICERALKKAILHRKNSLFYKSRNGARVGDMLMSLIYTCELSGVNPFDYLTELQRHADEVTDHPQRWMPWTYRESLVAA
jgi:hypothetical protein